jgi:hypothetical protein
MYQTELHRILVSVLKGTLWTRSTKDEDNFRQVVCASIYKHISENNVEIPSTRSGHGDIKIFNRKIELKYASTEKQEDLDSITEDFELLLESRIEFSIVAAKIDTPIIENHLHRCIHFPKLKQEGEAADFGRRTHDGAQYRNISIFLAATYPHAPTIITETPGKGNKSSSYLSFESSHSLSKSSFLTTHKGLIHVDVVGSREDGLICFLFKRANNIELVRTAPAHGPIQIEIPYAPPIRIATCTHVDVWSRSKKRQERSYVNNVLLESQVPNFDITI